MVAVMDPHSLEIRWWAQGPWIQQHDPDFTTEGEISVYNNNRGRSGRLDPEHRFYSSYMGKHNYLENKAMQVAVPWEGRALEFDKEGNLILEINNVFSEEFNAFVADYTWLSPDFFDVPDLAYSEHCSDCLPQSPWPCLACSGTRSSARFPKNQQQFLTTRKAPQNKQITVSPSECSTLFFHRCSRAGIL